MAATRERYSFGRFTVDFGERLLLRDGQPIAVRDKVFAALECFVRNPGNLLSKEELLEAIWPDAHVSEANLNQTISELRRLLGDAELIQTVPKRGFRFVAPKRDRRMGRIAAPIVAAAVFVAILASPVGSQRSDETRAVGSVSVVPFRMLGGSGADQYIATSLTETLSTRLASVPRLIVHPAPIDDRVQTDEIVRGSVQPIGGRIKINAQIIDARRNTIVWSRFFDCAPADLAIIEDSLATDVANKLRPGLTEEERSRLTPPHSADPIASDEYLRGREMLDRRRLTVESVPHFERAIARDPNFALAWAGLAEALAVPWGPPGSNDVTRAEDAARRAIRLEPSLAEGHAVLGFIDLFYRWNFPAAERELRFALSVKPGSARLHDWYALVCMTRGDMNAAIREAQRAHEIDPLAADIAADVALMLYEGRDYSRAEHAARAALNSDATTASDYLIHALAMQRRTEEAVAAIASAELISQNQKEYSRLLVLAMNGEEEARRRAIEMLRRPSIDVSSPDGTGEAFALLGQPDEAITWLERGYREHAFGMIFIGVSPELDSIRDDPRFRDLIRRVGVIEPANAADSRSLSAAAKMSTSSKSAAR